MLIVREVGDVAAYLEELIVATNGCDVTENCDEKEAEERKKLKGLVLKKVIGAYRSIATLGGLEAQQFAVCSCGHTGNNSLCDGSHQHL